MWTGFSRSGGAQAVAALAYGTETVPRVDKIVGPGNLFVATAKRLVFGRVDIDMTAGPSEVLIITDGHGDPRHLAADLLAQAEHDEQAVPLLVTEPPLVGTGMERKVALDSGAMILAKADGEVVSVTADRIVVKTDRKEHSTPEWGLSGLYTYSLSKFHISNQECCINQRPLVKVGDKVKKGDVLADGPATACGDLALGRNILVAFMSWHGCNFEVYT